MTFPQTSRTLLQTTLIQSNDSFSAAVRLVLGSKTRTLPQTTRILCSEQLCLVAVHKRVDGHSERGHSNHAAVRQLQATYHMARQQTHVQQPQETHASQHT